MEETAFKKARCCLQAVPRGGFLIARNEVRHADNQAPGIKSDAFKSAKRDELTQGREFAQSDARSRLFAIRDAVDIYSEQSAPHRVFTLVQK